MLELNGKTDIPSDAEALSPLHASVADAVRRGADAVGYTLYVVTPAQETDFRQLRQVHEDAQRFGMPLIVWAYPRGAPIEAKGGTDSFYAVDYAARAPPGPKTCMRIWPPPVRPFVRYTSDRAGPERVHKAAAAHRVQPLMATRTGGVSVVGTDERRAGRVPDQPVPPGLQPFWDKSVRDFVRLDEPQIDAPMQERHRIYSLLLMGIILDRWNGNKYGEAGDYGQWRANQLLAKSPNVYEGGTYQGHNIAALAVDAEGRVIDYDFNHNDVFDSSVEHAESRLVRRVFALNQVYDPWQLDKANARHEAGVPRRQERRMFATAITDRAECATARSREQVSSGYSTLLSDVTVYTSLESCAQCTGIMCLASVKQVVYLQPDDGQFLIGNIMRRATKAQSMSFTSPRPIAGDEIGFSYYHDLAAGNEDFGRRVVTEPFYTDGVKPVQTPSVTSYLCTDNAYRVYAGAASEFNALNALHYPDYRTDVTSAMTNREVLAMAKDFLLYVKSVKNRGTAHRV